MPTPHILAIPYPAQGHVIPLLELSQCLVKKGFKVTVVNSDYNHKRILNALGDKDGVGDQIKLVSVPDGLEPWEDRKDLARLCVALVEVMPGKVGELIAKINGSSGENEKISCVIADYTMGWAFEVAEKMGIPRRAAFWPASAGVLASSFCIPKFLDDGIVNEDGTPVKEQKIQLAPGMLWMNPKDFAWSCFGDLTTRKVVFDVMSGVNKFLRLIDRKVCNSMYELEPGAFTHFPDIIPIGPLLASNRLGDQMGNFWTEDSTCLKWLDQQSPKSVIYVAFGSFTVFDRTQFQELALGLELSEKPFLWVVRPDLTSEGSDAYPEGFRERISNKSQLVGWAPQQRVLSHPSIACFVSHCGWNSTMESVANGVPFLCWPYFGDQFFNEGYICDVWKVGLRFKKNDEGIITREEIKNQIEQLMGHQEFKKRALELQKVVRMNVSEDGQSNKNLESFIQWIKA